MRLGTSSLGDFLVYWWWAMFIFECLVDLPYSLQLLPNHCSPKEQTHYPHTLGCLLSSALLHLLHLLPTLVGSRSDFSL